MKDKTSEPAFAEATATNEVMEALKVELTPIAEAINQAAKAITTITHRHALSNGQMCEVMAYLLAEHGPLGLEKGTFGEHPEELTDGVMQAILVKVLLGVRAEQEAKAEWDAFQPEEGTIEWYDKFFVDQVDLGSPICTPDYYRNVKMQLAEWKQEREDFGDDEAWLEGLREQYEEVQADIAQWDADAAREKASKELVKAVRDHAQEHYDDGGWDYVVEAWEDKDILKEIGDATTPEGAIQRVALTVEVLADRQRDAKPVEGWHY